MDIDAELAVDVMPDNINNADAVIICRLGIFIYLSSKVWSSDARAKLHTLSGDSMKGGNQ